MLNSKSKHYLYAVFGYIVISAVSYILLNQFGAPFVAHQPLVKDASATDRFWDLQAAALWGLILIGIIVIITRSYRNKQLNSPDRVSSKKEIFLLLGYMVFAQLLGLGIGKLFDFHAISFHLAGSIYGNHGKIMLSEMLVWSCYNFIMYVVLPLVYFISKKGYTLSQLNIISNKNILRDMTVIIIILIIESIVQLEGLSDALLNLSPRQIIFGGFMAFIFNLFGTAIPTAVFLFAILYPRFKAVTNSAVTPIILGGLTYTALHFFDSWMVFSSSGAFLASLSALFMQYFMPGVVKSVLTDRTGNPWVHMWAYHVFVPHVIIDTPHFVDSFNIQ
ncbi:hypothetical protein SAMN05444392_103192 [Seinonella peptonophila]|uniref:Uncharacterized protein n=1 Tax=Seinonella peptonophila TaxID=112248 RepID=A0A1M4WEX9_9BACL|nr:hypothetical protein [Seinonella peptonophila]SHE79809.1 hypothetical protein SAMN05444392_103192 [Seinonella peptonophila]